jgi:hypothetical protein
VISETGIIDIQAQGAMKFSPDGKKVCVVTGLQNLVQLFDFDHETGVVSNPVTLPSEPMEFFYSCSFSPDNSKLYLATLAKRIVQYDLNAGSINQIIASRFIVYDNFYQTFGFSSGILQLGMDYRLYIARPGFPTYDTLAVIEYPNLYGSNCGLNGAAIYLGGPSNGNISTSGLANFDESYFNQSKDPFPCMKVGMEEVDFLDDYVTVAPNPANESATIQTTSDLILQFEITIVDQQGVEWAKKQLNGTHTRLQTAGLPPGLYLLMFQNQKQLFSKKLIIHH